MSNIDEIREKNLTINNKFNELINQIKRKRIKTFNEDGSINESIKRLLELELRKCIMIYCFEFGFEFPTEQISVHEARTHDGQINTQPELNARGDTDGVSLYPGLQQGLNTILKSPQVGLQGTVLEDGKIHATSVFGQELFPTKLSGNNNVSSNRDQLDYFAELLLMGKIDLDFILDVFPHEVMHIFIPGQGVLVEGATERLSREVCDKYGIRLSPTSHSKETAIISRLEAFLGRNAIASIALSNYQKSRRTINKDSIDEIRYESLRVAYDEKFGVGSFDKFKENLDSEYRVFLSKRTTPDEFPWYRNSFISGSIKFLDEWISNNPDSLQVLNNSVDLNNYQKSQIMDIQDTEINALQTLIDQNKQNETEKEL